MKDNIEAMTPKPKNKAAQDLARLSWDRPPSEARKKASVENGKKGGRPAMVRAGTIRKIKRRSKP